jgi:lipopolysaccharide transport system permease protein
MAEFKEKHIRPKASRWELGLKEIWEYRELLYFLTLKQIKTKYKQTAIGVGWAVLQPLLTTIVFSVIFYSPNVGGFSTGGVKPMPFLYAGLMLWTFFSTALNGASMSLIANAPMVTKVYFPRILLPLSLVIAALLDYGIAWGLFFVIVVVSGEALSLFLPLVIVPLILTFLLVAGVSFLMSAMAAKYRDVQYIVPFFITILLYATPVLYPLTWVQNEGLKLLFTLNPLSGIMSAQRAFIFGSPLDVNQFLVAIPLTVAVFFLGMLYFKAYERRLADVI